MSTTESEVRWLTRRQVAARLQVAPRTLQTWESAGTGIGALAVRMTGGTVRYPLDAVEQWEYGELRTKIRRQVAESRARQGLPPTVSDEATLDRVAALIVGTETEAADDGAP